ncbi:hypothetical protein [Sphingobium yanoikuyae]|uniref:hypothetical protein n=1 Tax=Sphingobium yanoikuyae TaxID=13690 RepID=UPI0026F0EDC7|nr:hypothetical protein [Sphingobium yanoikuyae]
MAKKLITVLVTLSVDDHISAKEAIREMRTRVDEVCGHYWDASEKKVRVQKAALAQPKGGDN